MTPPTSRKEALQTGSTTYFTGIPCRFGHVSVRRTDNRVCRECSLPKKRQKAHKDRIQHPAKHMWMHAKKRAKEQDLPFEITVEDIELLIPINRICPILGIPMQQNACGFADDSMSLDKLKPELGYVKDNIAVISYLANRIKSNVSDPTVLRKIAEWLEKT